ncbi:Tetraspannin [Oryctes borbonicus]|uniref:Tetraspannin n=1 Tax=Oryctes borbonicus TaxID=1629725 RepID=A0A0T6B9M1_9SCAR|nr:Tetraspannin [Oryctes borbonicus]
MSSAIKLTVGCLFFITAQYPIELRSHLQNNFNHYLDNPRSVAAQTFLEDEHDCCGIVNYSDYAYLNISEEPDSCYRNISDVARVVKRDGCAKNMENHYMVRMNDIGLICLLVGSFEVSASFFFDEMNQ